LRAAVEARLAAEPFDVVQYEYVEMGQIMPTPTRPTILTVVQLGFAAARDEWRAGGGGARRAAIALYRYLRDLDFELTAAARAHHVITMSAEDAARLRRFLPDLPVSVSPMGVDTRHFRPPARQESADTDVLFVGNFIHPPNGDAAHFLVEDIVPRIGGAGRALAEERFDWDAIAAAHEEIYERVLTSAGAPAAANGRPALERAVARRGRPIRLAAGAALLALRGARWHLGGSAPVAP